MTLPVCLGFLHGESIGRFASQFTDSAMDRL